MVVGDELQALARALIENQIMRRLVRLELAQNLERLGGVRLQIAQHGGRGADAERWSGLGDRILRQPVGCGIGKEVVRHRGEMNRREFAVKALAQPGIASGQQHFARLDAPELVHQSSFLAELGAAELPRRDIGQR